MTMKTIKITDATATQLAEFATTMLGLDGIRPQMGAAKIIAIMEPVYSKETIEVPDDAPQPAAPKDITPGFKKPVTSAEAYWNEKVQVRINVSEEKGGDRPIPVAVNGIQILVPRGKDVMLSRKYAEVLMKALHRTAITDENSHIVGWRESPLYPVMVNDPMTGPGIVEAVE
jgi:hypothetical protein